MRPFLLFSLAFCLFSVFRQARGQVFAPGPPDTISVQKIPDYLVLPWQIRNDFDEPGKTVINNPRQRPVTMSAEDSGIQFLNILMYDFYATLSLIEYTNGQSPDQHNEVSFYYNFTLSNSFKIKYFNLKTYIYNEYGVRSFFDSISIKSQDKYIIKNTLIIPIRKKIRLQLSQNIQSQIWDTYQYRTLSNGEREKYLYSDYFSPGYITYGAGLNVGFMKNCSLDINLVGSRITKVRNNEIYDSRHTTSLYGLKKDERRKVDYGLGLRLSVPPRKINKHFGWECVMDSYAAKDKITTLSGYSFDLMNVFHYICLKNLRFSLRTIARYDEAFSSKVFVSNMLTFGFYLSNEL